MLALRANTERGALVYAPDFLALFSGTQPGHSRNQKFPNHLMENFPTNAHEEGSHHPGK